MLSTTQMHTSSILIYEKDHFDRCTLFLIRFEYPVYWEVFAQSPSFSRQELNTGFHNGIQVNANTHTQTKVDYQGPLDNSSNIQRVTYFDGKTLNATLWLGEGIRQNPSGYGASTVVYGMLIDSDNNPATGKFRLSKRNTMD